MNGHFQPFVIQKPFETAYVQLTPPPVSVTKSPYCSVSESFWNLVRNKLYKYVVRNLPFLGTILEFIKIKHAQSNTMHNLFPKKYIYIYDQVQNVRE